jgi:hypothetical protein
MQAWRKFAVAAHRKYPIELRERAVDGRTLRPRGFSDDARAILEHVWALMGMPCGKYLVVMLGLWLPLLAAAGDLDKPFATEQALAELEAMSAATVDRYLKPARERMRIMGISTTKPSPLLRNSIMVRTCSDEAPDAPGVIEADTVAHCGPTLIGEFARTLTMTDMVIGWTENHSIRNNAATWILAGVAELTERFPFPMVVFDSSAVVSSSTMRSPRGCRPATSSRSSA